jgi:hypothetical protein
VSKVYFSAGSATIVVEKLKDGRFDACTYKEGRLLTQQKKTQSEIEQFAHELLCLAGVD